MVEINLPTKAGQDEILAGVRDIKVATAIPNLPPSYGVELIDTSRNFIPPTGIRQLWVSIFGASGGGGGGGQGGGGGSGGRGQNSSTNGGGGSGGSGGTAGTAGSNGLTVLRFPITLDSSEPIPVTIGSGGDKGLPSSPFDNGGLNDQGVGANGKNGGSGSAGTAGKVGGITSFGEHLSVAGGIGGNGGLGGNGGIGGSYVYSGSTQPAQGNLGQPSNGPIAIASKSNAGFVNSMPTSSHSGIPHMARNHNAANLTIGGASPAVTNSVNGGAGGAGSNGGSYTSVSVVAGDMLSTLQVMHSLLPNANIPLNATNYGGAGGGGGNGGNGGQGGTSMNIPNKGLSGAVGKDGTVGRNGFVVVEWGLS